MQTWYKQSYTLPKDMPSDFYHPDHVDKLVQALSTGIVSLEVRLEVEHVPVDLLGHHVSKAAVAAMSAPNLSLRKIGLYMRLTEVEGKRLMHSKNIYAPIVQLMVASDGPEGKIHKVSTLSVAGRPATTSAAPKTLSSVKGQLKAAAKKASKEGPLSGLRGFMNSMMHQPKTKKPCADAAKGTKGQRKGRPLASDKVKGLRKGKALADQNPHRFGAMSESKHLSQHHNHSSLHRAKSACHAFMRSLRESAVFVAVILVFMASLDLCSATLLMRLTRGDIQVIGAIHVARLLRYWRSSSRPSYEPLASQEGQEKHHLAVAFEPPPYQDENGVAQSLYYPDFANSPVDVLYDASESDDHTDEKTADTHS